MATTMRRRGPAVGRLADVPSGERPREKLIERGPDALSDEELLALVLGTGAAGRPVLETSRELLRGGWHQLVGRSGRELVSHAHGIGPAKAARLEAVMEIARRVTLQQISDRDLLSDPDAAETYLKRALAGETREVMGALLLDAKNRLVRNALVFEGSTTSASVAPAPLFRQAILSGATGLILYHNHPSGDPEPSPEDRATTARFVAAGREIGIEVRDHIVVGRGRCVSFVRRGLL